MQLLPNLYLFFISPQKLEKTVAKIFITSPELWKRHLWAILFSSVCHQILSSSLHPLLQHSICFSLHLRGGHFMLMSWAALAASALFVCSVYRELLFGAVGSDKARLSLSQTFPTFLSGNIWLETAERIKLHIRESRCIHVCRSPLWLFLIKFTGFCFVKWQYLFLRRFTNIFLKNLILILHLQMCVYLYFMIIIHSTGI